MQAAAVQLIIHSERRKKSAQPQTFRPMTLGEAKALRRGSRVFIRTRFETAAVCKVTSVQTWVRRPEDCEVRLQFGLKEFFQVRFVDGRPVRGTDDLLVQVTAEAEHADG